MRSGGMSTPSALPTARAVATRSADELAIPLPSGRPLSRSRWAPAGSPVSAMIISASRAALRLCAGRTWTPVTAGSVRNVATLHRATGKVTRKSPSSSGSRPCNSSPNVPYAVPTPVAPR
jgi:hypothetical protein